MASPTTAPRPSKGLTKPGVVILQTFFIGLFATFEILARHGVGIFTGLMICIAVIGTCQFGRSGTEYAAAATAPLAFAVVAFIVTALADGLHLTKVGVDFVASLASAAPYLIVAVAYAWFSYFRAKRNSSSTASLR